MTALGAEEIRTRVESDFSRIVDVLNQKIALQSISAKGITADHMKRSAQFVADLLREVGVDTKVVQSHNPTARRALGRSSVPKTSARTRRRCCTLETQDDCTGRTMRLRACLAAERASRPTLTSACAGAL